VDISGKDVDDDRWATREPGSGVIFTFEDCELDTALRELRKGGTAVHVQPQVFDVLAYLVQHHDRVVPKRELLDEVWGHRFVSESALTSRIKAARRAVDDDGTDQRIIKTFHTQGYRLVAAVTARTLRVVPAPVPTVGEDSLLERDDALATLDTALDDAVRGSGRVILVTGEPGIGKTALVRRFATVCGDRAPVLFGRCDDLVTPRPFGPFHDMTAAVPALSDALSAGVSPGTVQRLVLDEVDRSAHPTVLIIEDIHWADEATLDLVTLLSRRIADTHGLLVLTYRDTELGDDHPLLSVIGSIPAAVADIVQLAPLSRSAVAALVGDERAESVMSVTRGNPFYVTELAAGTTTDVTPSVRHAVLARVARLPDPTRDLLTVVAVAPGRLEVEVIEGVRPDWSETVVAAEHSGMLVVDETHVQFRHELARRAVLGDMPVGRRRDLNRQLLQVLVACGADPARIVHHAEAAGDHAVLATTALRAARAAAAAFAHREAHSQYRRALGSIDHLPPRQRAHIHEEASREAYLTAQETDALADASAALGEFEQVGDMLGMGRLHRWLSRLHWFGGRRAEADAAARRAIAVLEPLGPSTELAWAYSTLAQLAMLSDDDPTAWEWGTKAAALAEQLGDDAVRAHAEVNLGMVSISQDLDDEARLLDAVRLADAAGEHHEAARGLLGLAYRRMEGNRLASAADISTRALRYAEDHEVDALSHYIVAMLARIDVLGGRWADARARLDGVISHGGLVPRLLALTALALLQVRRGDHDAGETLARAWELAIPADELQRLAPLAAAEAERAWLAGELTPQSTRLLACYQQQRALRPALSGELARWLREAGHHVEPAESVDPAYQLEHLGRWEDAAAVWHDKHMPYDEAFCLAHLAHRRAAGLAIAEDLGARPLATWIRQRT
jgi:DNA-binding winged helix-turn-helix (wHTH) protein